MNANTNGFRSFGLLAVIILALSWIRLEPGNTSNDNQSLSAGDNTEVVSEELGATGTESASAAGGATGGSSAARKTTSGGGTTGGRAGSGGSTGGGEIG